MFFAIAFSYDPVCERPLDAQTDRRSSSRRRMGLLDPEGTGTTLHQRHNVQFDTA